jgi:uncharacterized membrane protein SpoIIM required for sporulation
MGESLKHFKNRRKGVSTLQVKKICSRSSLFLQWKTLDSMASDIAFLRARFFAHEESASAYQYFRNIMRKIINTGMRDENIHLYTDNTGKLKLHRRSALINFFHSKLALHHRTVISTMPYFVIVLSLFAVSAIVGFSIVTYFSHYGEFFLPQNIQEQLSRGNLWTNILSKDPISGGSQIIMNNILVSLKVFGLGILAGLPSVLMILFNGWQIGSIFAGTHQFGMSAHLLQFVLNHGVMEITIVLFSGALGLRLGLSFVSVPAGKRLSHFAGRFWESVNSMIIFCLWLFVCGIIESQVSPVMANTTPHYVMIPVSAIIGISIVLLYTLIHHGVPYEKKRV